MCVCVMYESGVCKVVLQYQVCAYVLGVCECYVHIGCVVGLFVGVVCVLGVCKFVFGWGVGVV